MKFHYRLRFVEQEQAEECQSRKTHQYIMDSIEILDELSATSNKCQQEREIFNQYV